MKPFKTRRGVSTILGVLIFIGIMFTAVIPMQLVMHQADVVFEQKKLERSRADDERGMELLLVYPVPSQIEPELNITLINVGEVPSSIIRVWVNNTVYDVSGVVSAFGSLEIGPFPAPTVEGAVYEVKVVTSRGNVFCSEIGALIYSGGKWLSETLGFNLVFPSRPGRGQRENNWLNELRVSIEQGGDILYSNETMHWAISASEMFIEVDDTGDYGITIYIWCKPPPYQHWEMIYSDTHSLTWPAGNPIEVLNFEIVGDHLELQ